MIFPQAAVPWCLIGVLVSTGPSDQSKQGKAVVHIHSPDRKISQKWQETGLEAGVERRLDISLVEVPPDNFSQEARTASCRARHMSVYSIT